MSKTINVGDVIFYKKIDSSYSLQEGDIIVFKNRLKKENIKLVHRIVKVQNYKDEIAGYYTKGDASDSIDQFFVYPDDVVGLYIGKINRIGYPIVLINKFISNFNGTRELYD
jgi:signal peptidase I